MHFGLNPFDVGGRLNVGPLIGSTSRGAAPAVLETPLLDTAPPYVQPALQEPAWMDRISLPVFQLKNRIYVYGASALALIGLVVIAVATRKKPSMAGYKRKTRR